MKKINILIDYQTNLWSFYNGYWSFFHVFKNDLEDAGIKVSFFYYPTSNFFDADFIFISNRFFYNGLTNRFKKNINVLESIKNFYSRNKNIVWFDLRDSAGTTQFEVMPYVKKYVKKQIYSDLNLYNQNMHSNRFYADFYHKNFSVGSEFQNYSTKLESKYSSKLILGWNLGVSRFFNFQKYTSFSRLMEPLKMFLKYDDTKMEKFRLPFVRNSSPKKDFHLSYNIRDHEDVTKDAILYQRRFLSKIIAKEYGDKINKKRVSKSDFFKNLYESKISIGAYGWGEVCYREFEAIHMGSAIITADMSKISTWPNIYIKNETYVPYDLDFSNLKENIESLTNNEKKRNYLIDNSQTVCKEIFSTKGRNYFITLMNKILT